VRAASAARCARRAARKKDVPSKVRDEGVFTTPWTATLRYVPGPDQIPKGGCAENPREYYNNMDSDIPKAEKPDF